MAKPKYAAQLENIYFLARIGESLRWATSDISREELPDRIRELLWRLDRMEARGKTERPRSGNDILG